MNLYDLSQALKSANIAQKYAETLLIFKTNKTLYAPVNIGANQYVVSEMITALIETNNYDAIFNFITQYSVAIEPKRFSYLLKKCKDKPTVNWNFVNKFCDLISVDTLGTNCQTKMVTRKGITKPMEYASDKENWYAIKTKALYETQQYQLCFELSKKALEVFDAFHYSNDVWFARRIALSKKNMGNTNEALQELLQILKRKRDWFIQYEVALIYKEIGNHEQCFNYAMQAINNFGDLTYKVSLLELIAEILLHQQKNELAYKHYMLCKLLRQKEGWPITPNLEATLQNTEYFLYTIEQMPKLQSELKNYWQSQLLHPTKQVPISKVPENGTIIKILNNDDSRGADGFIKYKTNQTIYFRINATDNIRKNLVVGLEVSFTILPAKQKGKKNMAIQIKTK
jgi:tetratricopeptide (TPR) repeat protein